MRIRIEREVKLYFVGKIEDEQLTAVKVGHSNDPERRLGELQVGCPDQLILLATRTYDNRLQARLEEYYFLEGRRERGEWVTVSADVLKEIEGYKIEELEEHRRGKEITLKELRLTYNS